MGTVAKSIPTQVSDRTFITISEDEAVVEVTLDVPFREPITRVRILPVAQAVRLFEEFEMLGEEGPKGLRPRSYDR